MNLKKYSGKTVLVTGVTGFKGSWIALWLAKLGAKVIGIADGIKTIPSMFETSSVKSLVEYHEIDVRDSESVRDFVKEKSPDFIFHLAAQAIVSESKINPIYTIETNTLGTTNILAALRNQKECTLILITSDKCYENREWVWGYREIDQLGGKDIYSASKAAAEIIASAFVRTYFSSPLNTIRVATARAGNVIGGGDWSKDRIVVDCITKWVEQEEVEIRSPNATRPWQHVLEPISGYLMLGLQLNERPEIHGQAFNFGPRASNPQSVVELISSLSERWLKTNLCSKYKISIDDSYNEAGLLQLNCEKAKALLNWETILSFEETVELTSDWYDNHYSSRSSSADYSISQIEFYEKLREIRGFEKH